MSGTESNHDLEEQKKYDHDKNMIEHFSHFCGQNIPKLMKLFKRNLISK